MMQKLINLPSDAVVESLEGFAFAHADLVGVHFDPHFVYRRNAPIANKVTVISGAGSGHEPLNIGYVGAGMLDAACPGPIFTSPTPNQYLAALDRVYGGVGVFFVVKNYMGGVLNTEIAMEMAGEAGMPVASVLIHDDVSLAQSANRRGMGAAVLVEKIAGAAAEAGRSLAEVASVARRASERTRSMGVALSGCTSLAAGRPSFQLPAGEIEVGVGIHGEPGRQRSRWVTADEVVDLLAAPILQELALKSGDRVLVMVSGLGGTPSHELYIVFRRLHQVLDRLGVVVERQLIGSYITSLDMAGCTVTILPLDAELLALWDAPVHTPALHW